MLLSTEKKKKELFHFRFKKNPSLFSELNFHSILNTMGQGEVTDAFLQQVFRK